MRDAVVHANFCKKLQLRRSSDDDHLRSWTKQVVSVLSLFTQSALIPHFSPAKTFIRCKGGPKMEHAWKYSGTCITYVAQFLSLQELHKRKTAVELQHSQLVSSLRKLPRDWNSIATLKPSLLIVPFFVIWVALLSGRIKF